MKHMVGDLAPNKMDEANLNALAVIKNAIDSPEQMVLPSFIAA